MDFDDRGVVSLPKLVGGPRYSRPPVPGVAHAPRPPDPDEFPLVSERTPEEHALAQELGIEPSASGSVATQAAPSGAAAEESDQAHHPNGTWTVANGVAAGQARSGVRGFGLFRGRNGRSGIG